jgi:hypothetical protein
MAASSFTIPRPDLADPAEQEPVVLHDDFRRIVSDTALSFHALNLVQRLLRGVPIESPVDDVGTSGGLMVLLEGIQGRLNFAVDGLVETAAKLGIEDNPVDLRGGLLS